MPMFLTDAQVKQAIADVLKQDVGSLVSYWTDIVADAHNAASNEIVAVLTDRGYTAAQVAAWDRGAEFEKDISLYWCLVKGAGMHAYDGEAIGRFDRRKELATVPVLNSGAVVTPSSTTVGQSVGFGYQSTTPPPCSPWCRCFPW